MSAKASPTADLEKAARFEHLCETVGECPGDTIDALSVFARVSSHASDGAAARASWAFAAKKLDEALAAVRAAEAEGL